MIKLEVCIDSAESGMIAQEGGAFRVELCDNLCEGGTTPSCGQILFTRELLNIKLHVIIRPRGGDFLYNDMEFEIMKSDIHVCGKVGCDGVVIGMLFADGTIDVDRCSQLIEIARQYNMSVTFHRAFDRCNDLFQGLEDVIGLGCERILTSGGENTAPEGADILRQLIEQAGDRIIIMPGAGINGENIGPLVRETHLKEFHGTFRGRVPGGMSYKNLQMNDQEGEYNKSLTDIKKVRDVLKSANEANASF